MEYRELGRTGLRISRIGFGGIPIQRVEETDCSPLFDALVAAGVKGIWNFTNYEISFDQEDVVVESVHFSDSLLALSYMISQKEAEEEDMEEVERE